MIMSTTVNEIRNAVLLLSNPYWELPTPGTTVTNITAKHSDITYSTRISGNITVLAPRTTPDTGGLLYVPDLPPDDVCAKRAEPFVPASVVRLSGLPPTDNYNLIALAPWISSTCSKKYMDAASRAPIRALIFYRPNNSSATPPHATSAVWEINGSTRWRAKSPYLVFAVPGLAGQNMMRQLSLYSGDVTEVPFAQNISEIYAPYTGDYVRIWTDLDVSTTGALFGIWVYFLIIIAVLIAIISGTSLTMHLAQVGRRVSLRRRVISGDVNLEAMGIRRVTVPMTEIQKFPLYTYRYEPSESGATPREPPETLRRSPSNSAHAQDPPEDAGEKQSHPQHTGSRTPLAIATDPQPICTICLEHFQNRTTVIREIPCGHIFHPECIDEFLGEVSSLCPICRASMLPKRYCPKITNDMVRREFAIRRFRHTTRYEDGQETPPVSAREHGPALDGLPMEDGGEALPRRWRRLRSRVFPGY
ncbi:hypothetical protein B0T14DRAFT_8604 [Immersiella caudata]|uniref:RING-type domain-containing protein n=1 Tax=Immersiella caudata TaxID=314043 RepID=A0AA39XD17_9PEZI|nr:hypothetical protein B0T14DRAFT_8604 [Immersiella caudata]